MLLAVVSSLKGSIIITITHSSHSWNQWQHAKKSNSYIIIIVQIITINSHTFQRE